MKTWKNRWKEELDSLAPDLRDDVKNAPIRTDGAGAESNGGNTAALARNKQKIIAVAATILAFVCALIVCLCLLLPKKGGISLFTIEINPAVTMAVDDGGKVTGVIASNGDADVILSADGVRENIVGKSVDEAALYYTDQAARLGFIDLSSQGTAVRVTSCTDGKDDTLLRNTESSLKNYFVQKGVFAVVIGESVSGEEFARRSGIPAARTVEEAAEYVQGRSVLFSERMASELDLNELQSLYEKEILEDRLMPLVEGSLRENLDKLKKNSEDLVKISGLYLEIYGHEDNPAVLLKDYWEVKKYYGDNLTGEFARLVSEMDDALLKYEADYGVKITGIAELQSAVNGYAAVSVEKITLMLENFTLELFEECSENLSEIMRAVGILSDEVLSLMRLPESAEEYSDKVLSAVKEEYGYRAEEYESAYGQVREPISERDYEKYLEGIISEYGSLSEYWQARKN